MPALTDASGGTFIHNTNDLGGGLNQPPHRNTSTSTAHWGPGLFRPVPDFGNVFNERWT
jgi:hypothetical protein